MEEEARDILKAALANEKTGQRNLAESIRAWFAPLGGVDLPDVPREPMRRHSCRRMVAARRARVETSLEPAGKVPAPRHRKQFTQRGIAATNEGVPLS